MSVTTYTSQWRNRTKAELLDDLHIVIQQRDKALHEMAQLVASQREAFLPSVNLDPAWIAGWHAAIDHCVSGFDPTPTPSVPTTQEKA